MGSNVTITVRDSDFTSLTMGVTITSSAGVQKSVTLNRYSTPTSGVYFYQGSIGTSTSGSFGTLKCVAGGTVQAWYFDNSYSRNVYSQNSTMFTVGSASAITNLSGSSIGSQAANQQFPVMITLKDTLGNPLDGTSSANGHAVYSSTSLYLSARLRRQSGRHHAHHRADLQQRRVEGICHLHQHRPGRPAADITCLAPRFMAIGSWLASLMWSI